MNRKKYKVTINDGSFVFTDIIKACDAKDAAYITLHKLSNYNDASFPVRAWISNHIAINAFNVNVSVIHKDDFLHVKVTDFYKDDDDTGETEIVARLIVEVADQ